MKSLEMWKRLMAAVFAAFLVGALSARAAESPNASRTLVSPDGLWTARVVSYEEAGVDGRPDEPKVSFALVRAGGKTTEEDKDDEPGEPDFTYGGTLESVKWSPDSRFLVAIFEPQEGAWDIEGHPAIVWCAADETFRDLNGYFPDGWIADSSIGFEGQDSVVLSIAVRDRTVNDPGGSSGEKEDPDFVMPMGIDLSGAAPGLLPLNRGGLPEDGADPICLESPDGQWMAVARINYDQEMPAKTDFNGFRLFIIRADGETDDEEWRFRGDCPAARTIDNMQWSPDSRFLVITTQSSGGHSPVNETTYVYSLADNTFRWLSNYRDHRRVTRPEMCFTGENTVHLGVLDGHAHTVAISLARDIHLMKEAAENLPPAGEDDEDGSEPEPAADLQQALSLDGKWFAAVRQIPDEKEPWKKSLDHFRLIVASAHGPDPGEVVLRYDDDAHRRVEDFKWSPDSRFLVIGTWNAGAGRISPARLCVYCVQDGSLRDLSDCFKGREAGNAQFEFNDGDTLVAARGFSGEQIEIPLHKEMAKMKKMEPGIWNRR